jgi:hypothetical protein
MQFCHFFDIAEIKRSETRHQVRYMCIETEGVSHVVFLSRFPHVLF